MMYAGQTSKKGRGVWLFIARLVRYQNRLENVFVKNYAPNHMSNPKGEWSLKENNSELHYGVRSKIISSSTPWSVTICQI